MRRQTICNYVQSQKLNMSWELVNKVVRNLGTGWQVDAGALQQSGEYRALASGPDDMQLFFIARTEKIDTCVEHICPPLGWLRVDGRLHFTDPNLSARLSIELRETLTGVEIAKEINARLLPIYKQFLDVMANDQKIQLHGTQRMLTDIVRKAGKALLSILGVILLIGLWAYIGGAAIGLIRTLLGPERVPFLIANSPTVLFVLLLAAVWTIYEIKRNRS